ncbi:MAG: hypothetical protein HGB12_07005, partial [Bacteroidetes bacterium]|nr:hypothetical protein [Bacteroidota bacterium]
INSAKKFDINAGKLFIIKAGKTLTVNGPIDNSSGIAGFVLKSDNKGTASLIHNTDNVPATVERYITGVAEDWHFLSTPVSDQEITGSWLPSGTYGNGTGYDLYVWNEPTSCWIYKLNLTSPVNWNTVHPDTNFNVGRGYLYSVQATNPSKEFAGKLNNGSIDYPLTIGTIIDSLRGFNLVGNPYPSSIDWAASSGWMRSLLVNSNDGYDMWIWNPAANNYGAYNSSDADGVGTNSVTRYIAPTQGYFVRAASAGNMSTSNPVRVHSTASWFKLKDEYVNRVSLVVNSDAGYGFDEVRLSFGNFQNENGAMKLFSHVLAAPSLFMPNQNGNFSVQYFTNTSENPVVPISFTPGIDGNYTFNCNFDLDKFDIVMLEDLQTHYIQNMKYRNTYNFKALKKDDPNRFVLYFGPDQNHSGKDIPGRIYSDGVHLIVDLSLVPEETEVFVYDVLGRLLLQQKLQGKIVHQLDMNPDTQILICYLKNTNGSLCKKLYFSN